MENGGTRKLGDIMDNISNLISHSFLNHSKSLAKFPHHRSKGILPFGPV